MDKWMDLGRRVDLRPDVFAGVEAAKELLRIRDKHGEVVPLVANRAQREFEKQAGRSNIVLKARQMGLTTWIAGRFLLKSILIASAMFFPCVLLGDVCGGHNKARQR